MTYAFVGEAHNSTSSNVTTLTVTYSPTAGNGLIVIYSYQASQAVNVTGITNQSGTALPYTEISTGLYDAPSFNALRAFWVPNVPSGVTGIKVNTDFSKGIGLQVLEYSGLATTNSVAGSAKLQATATTATDNISAAITPTGQPGMLFACGQNMSRNAAPTAGTGFTSRASAVLTEAFSSQTVRGEDKRITSTSATNALFTNASTRGDTFQTLAAVILEPGVPATLTSPTPSGTLSTATTATPGATTDKGSGTGYCVVTTSSLSGVTAAQVKAGQNAAGSTTGVFNSNGSVTATGAFTCPSLTGLTASALYNYAVVQNTIDGDSNVVTGTFTTHAPVPTITGVSSMTPANGSTLTLTGTTFGSSQGAGDTTLGGASQVETSWNNTTIALTVDRTTNKSGVAVNVTVTNNAGDTSSAFALTNLQPAAGWSFVDIGTPDTTAADRLTTTGGGDLASGDQVEWGNVVGTGTVTVSSDGTFAADPGVTSFDYRAWSVSGGGWGTAQTEDLTAPAGTTSTAVVWF